MSIWSRLKELGEYRSQTFSVSDVRFAEWLDLTNDSGMTITESTAIGLTAVYRAVSIISGSIASLPLKTYRTVDGRREQVKSFLDRPGGDLLSPFAWKELVTVHLLLHGNAYLLHHYNNAGSIHMLQPIHPSSVGIETENGRKFFRVTMLDNSQRLFSEDDLTHIMAMSFDGVRGLSPIQACRNAIGTGLAGDKAAARMFKNGMHLGGIVSSEDENLDEEQAQAIKDGIRRNATGPDHSGDILVANVNMKFSPWTMTAEDAQFLESRAFQIEEIARLYGVPPHLLGQTDKQTSWGTGVETQNRGLAKFTLMQWTSRIEDKLSDLVANPRHCEFEYKKLLQPSPQEEIEMLARQIEVGLLTVNEGRGIMNLPPLQTQEIPNGTNPTER